ncbi:MAG: translation initiation factor IF-2 [Oscillospiraceae bacterium]|nr:translation initiation factor IF-2 [Oscillospiraceae bacterium]
MAKIRVFELAKELNVDGKVILEFLQKKDGEVKSQLSSLEEDSAKIVREKFGKKTETGLTDKAGAPGTRKSSSPSDAEGKSKAQTKAGAETEAEPKKKKKLIAVFHPQNASSKEGKALHRLNAGRGGQAPGSRERRPGRTQNSPVRGSRDGSAGTGNRTGEHKPPLVKVPRPQPMFRNTEPPKAFSKPVKHSRPQAAEEVSAPKTEITSAAEEAAATSKDIRTEAGAPEVRQAAGVQEANTSAKTPETKPAADTGRAGNTVEAGEKTAENRPQRTERPRGDQGRGRSYGNRDGQKPFSRDSRPSSGARDGRPSFGNRDGQKSFSRDGSRSFGNRDGRPSSGSRDGKPSYGNRDGQKPFNRDGSRSFGNRDARPGQGRGGRPAAAAETPADLSAKRRDGGHNKDKDKNKAEQRENKFTSDRKNGRSQKQLIPKALQKPVHKQKEEKKEEVTEIKLPEKMTIRELAEKMKMQPSEIVKNLFMKGEMYTVNQEIDYEKAEEIALEYDIIAEPEEKVDVIAELLKEDEEEEKDLVSRPPVVCVMGHVDHGKTSLLDYIRNTHVTDREAGGITQNIGAYSVKVRDRKVTFLDTPGHEAFTAMRMRGAKSTDIAVLVVAADDGVMPQTIEAINHAKAAGIEIIVAVNKIDKPGANVDRVKQELTEYGLVAEDWGGSTIFVPVSAKTGEGIDSLLDMILLTADILELKANPNRKARGLVLEAKLDKGKGPVANVLIQKGTLHVGDYIACGSASGKVRAMMDENSRRVKAAGPSTPVEVLGLNDVPNAGEVLVATDTDKDAKNFAATFISESKSKLLEDTKSRMSLDALFSQIQEGSLKELDLIVKADVQGSVEALKQSLLKLSNDEVVVKIIHGGVGSITETDVTLAAASNAIVIGFNVRPDATAKSMADQEGVDIRLYKVIYQAIDDIEAAMKGMLEPIYEEKVIGHAEVRQLFKASGVGTIAGSYVLDGMIQRGCKVRISRDDKQIFEGGLASLKRFKDDVKEVKAGYECGLVFDGFNELQENDKVEAYIMVEVPRSK